jgi:magnesium transporter
MKYKSIDNLDTEAVYLFLGSGWLITIHSSEVNLIATVRKMFAERNKRILESPIDALYYYILSNIIEKYEQLLTAIELKVLDFEKESLYQPTRKTLEKLDTLSKQAIVLRRHFWQARHVMNFLIHMEEDKEDVKYLQIVYTVNSTREIYAGSISLQLNDTMRILTVFSTILLPLTFITSIFGMQGFDLHNIHSIPQGFMIILATMMVIVVVLFYMFWKRKWIFVKNKIVKNGNSIDEVHDDKTSSNKTANKERTD